MPTNLFPTGFTTNQPASKQAGFLFHYFVIFFRSGYKKTNSNDFKIAYTQNKISSRINVLSKSSIFCDKVNGFPSHVQENLTNLLFFSKMP
jgi:hypothetical protein